MMYLADSGILSLIMAIIIGALAYAGDKEKKTKVRERFQNGARRSDFETDPSVWEGLPGKEGEPATIVRRPEEERVVESESVRGEESRKAAVTAHGGEGKDKLSEFRKRIKNSPKDLILFAELMKPKYKEL